MQHATVKSLKSLNILNPNEENPMFSKEGLNIFI